MATETDHPERVAKVSEHLGNALSVESKLYLLQGLPKDDFDALIGRMRRINLKKGEVIIRRG